MSKDLGKRLEELRKKNNLDAAALAGKLSVRRKDVENWEQGDDSPDGEQLIKLSHIYKMPIDEILLNFDTDSDFDYSGGYSKTQTQTPAAQTLQAVNANAGSYTPTSPVKPAYNWYMFPYPIIILFAYILIGFFFEIWHPTWLLFLTIPVYYQLVTVNRVKTFRKKANVFPFPVLCVIFYLAIGFDYELWHPAWMIFLTIPIYYMVVNGFKNS